MYVIGSNTIETVGDQAVPAGVWHAVDINGSTLCTGARAPYTFPSRAWTDDLVDGPACVTCLDTMTAVGDEPAEGSADHLTLVRSLDDAEFAAELAAVEAELAADDEPVEVGGDAAHDMAAHAVDHIAEPVADDAGEPEPLADNAADVQPVADDADEVQPVADDADEVQPVADDAARPEPAQPAMVIDLTAAAPHVATEHVATDDITTADTTDDITTGDVVTDSADCIVVEPAVPVDAVPAQSNDYDEDPWRSLFV